MVQPYHKYSHHNIEYQSNSDTTSVKALLTP